MSVIFHSTPHAPHNIVNTKKSKNSKVRTAAVPKADQFTRTFRAKALSALKDPSTFHAFMSDSEKVSPTIKALRQEFGRNKISSKELVANPELRLNFYEHNVVQLLSHWEPSKKQEPKQEAILETLFSMKDAANSIRQELGLLPSNLHDSVKIAAQEKTQQNQQKGKPKFGWGLMVGLAKRATDAIMYFSDKSKYKQNYAAYANFGERKNVAKGLIWGHSVAAGLFGVASNKFYGEDALLLTTTVTTILRMAKGIYGITNTSEGTLAAILSKLVAYRLADGAASFALEKLANPIPILGEVVSGLSAFGVHKLTAWFFFGMFEYQIHQGQKPGLPESVQALMSFTRLAAASGLDFDEDATERHFSRLNEIHAQLEPENYSIRTAIQECDALHLSELGNFHSHMQEVSQLVDEATGEVIGNYTDYDNPVFKSLSLANSFADLQSFKERLQNWYGEHKAKEIFRQAKCRAIATSTIELGPLLKSDIKEVSAEKAINALQRTNLISVLDAQTLKKLLENEQIKPQLFFALATPLVQADGLSRESAMYAFDNQIKSCSDLTGGLNQARNAKEIIQNFILTRDS